MVVHGAGRVPDIEDLRLDIAGVEAADGKKGNGREESRLMNIFKALPIHQFMQLVMQ
jgi:hypothetical protein